MAEVAWDREQWVARLVEQESGPRGRGAEGARPQLVRKQEAADLVRAAVDAASLRLYIARRRMLAAGGGDQRYNEAVGEVQAALESASALTRMEKEAAAMRRGAGVGAGGVGEAPPDIKDLRSRRDEAKKEAVESTNATSKAKHLKRAWALDREIKDALRQEEIRAGRAVTDLNAAGLAGLKKNIGGLSKANLFSIDDGGPERAPPFHDGPDPIGWYD